jgi:RNA polymerase sigma factor (TIGR02999 family)
MPQDNDSSPRITELLQEWSAGRTDAIDELFPLVYSELRSRAAAYLRHERANHTLQTTALVHEAYLKLVDQRVPWKNRGHFFAIAAQAMRRILVDYARIRHRTKRGGINEDLHLEEILQVAAEQSGTDIAELDEALNRLAVFDPQQERLVELRYFGGLSLEESAEVLHISRATAAREWQVARAWLHRELTR